VEEEIYFSETCVLLRRTFIIIIEYTTGFGKKQFIKELCQDSFDILHLQAIYLGSAHQDRVIATRGFLIHGRVTRLNKATMRGIAMEFAT